MSIAYRYEDADSCHSSWRFEPYYSMSLLVVFVKDISVFFLNDMIYWWICLDSWGFVILNKKLG